MNARVRAIALAASLVACTMGDPATPAAEAPPVSTVDPGATPIATLPANVGDLFVARMMPTCSLNAGVCHNAKTYPDMRDLSALEDLFDLPCGVDVDRALPDACEPPGDRLEAGDAEVTILRASFDAAANTATLSVDGDLVLGERVELRRALARGTWTFDLAAAGVELSLRGPRTIDVRLASATAFASSFFVPSLPLREDHVWPADANGNGIAGASLGWREIVPGRPDRSWVIARLWDTSASPELMPRQCREWDDDATRALACWIEGLRRDDLGAVTNFWDPVDYARCKFSLPSAGRCGAGATAP